MRYRIPSSSQGYGVSAGTCFQVIVGCTCALFWHRLQLLLPIPSQNRVGQPASGRSSKPTRAGATLDQPPTPAGPADRPSTDEWLTGWLVVESRHRAQRTCITSTIRVMTGTCCRNVITYLHNSEEFRSVWYWLRTSNDPISPSFQMCLWLQCLLN